MADTRPALEAKYVFVPSGAGSQQIHYLTAGPPRSPPTPVVIFVSGLGTTCLGFTTTMRNLADAGIRSYAFDRPGMGRSPGIVSGEADSSDADPVVARPATLLAAELAAFLTAAAIPPPYVLVPHSYGGVISREFLEMRPRDVVGMVMIDANCEGAADRELNPADIGAIIKEGEVDYFEVIGGHGKHRLRADEWAEMIGKADPPEGFTDGQGGEVTEAAGYFDSARALKRLGQYEKHVLGRKPVSVVKGNVQQEVTILLKLADEKGIDHELRDRVRKVVPGINNAEMALQRKQLQLAEDGCGRMVDVMEAGHYVMVSHPEIVSKEIEWVMEQVRERKCAEH